MRKKKERALIIPEAPLKVGQMGYAVLNLQIVLDDILKAKGRQNLVKLEPAHFGPHTERALRQFQDKYDLFVNGQYTPLTRLRIKEVLNADRGI